MAEQWMVRVITEGFDNGAPFSEWADLGFDSAPEGWEGRNGKIGVTNNLESGYDLMLFRHKPCGIVWSFGAGIVGPRAFRSLLTEHPKICQGKVEISSKEGK